MVEATPAKPPRTPSTPKPSDDEIKSDSSSQASGSKPVVVTPSEPEAEVKSAQREENSEIPNPAEIKSSDDLKPAPSKPADPKPTESEPTSPIPVDPKPTEKPVEKPDEKIQEEIPDEKSGT